MKILKQGKSKEEVDRIIKRVRQFECSICGCVFEADGVQLIQLIDFGSSKGQQDVVR